MGATGLVVRASGWYSEGWGLNPGSNFKFCLYLGIPDQAYWLLQYSLA